MDEKPFTVEEDELIADTQSLLKDIEAALRFSPFSRGDVLDVLVAKLTLIVCELRRYTESVDES